MKKSQSTLHRVNRAMVRVSLMMAVMATGLARADEPRNGAPKTAAGKPAEGELGPFLDEPKFDVQEIFRGERFPNVVVATDGTVVATWGNRSYRVRRSEDGDATWGPEIVVADPGFQGGGTIDDERSGDILVFVEAGHPSAPSTRSSHPGLESRFVSLSLMSS